LALGVAPALAAEARLDPWTAGAQASRLLDALRRAGNVPAVSAAVGRDGQLLWSAALGQADLETGGAATPSTRFRCGSVSKVFTVTALAQLAERGVVDLDAPIQTHLPDYPTPAGGPPITLRRLAGHLAGVRHYRPEDFAAGSRHYDTLGEALELFAADPLEAPPGERYKYSTHGYTLIGAVLEAATGKPFLQVMRDEVWAPLGLLHSGGDDSASIVPGRSELYEWGEAGRPRNAHREDPSYKWPAGGLLSTAEDLVRLGMAQLGPQVTAARRALLFTPQTTSAGETTNVGLGWRVGKDFRGRTVYHHAGAMAGARAVLVLYPESGVVVALMSNLSFVPGEAELTAQVLAAGFQPAAPAREAGAPAALPTGDFAYEGSLRDQPIAGTLRLSAGGEGKLGVPPALAELYRKNEAPPADDLELIEVRTPGIESLLALATPFGLLPAAVERTPDGGLTATALGGNLTWSFTATAATPAR
jgi:CubicO group peptidase (beta-lactamase class C family)